MIRYRTVSISYYVLKTSAKIHFLIVKKEADKLLKRNLIFNKYNKTVHFKKEKIERT